MKWAVVSTDEKTFFVHLGAHVHPIPFETEREARRAAERLNVRDSKERHGH